MVEEEKVQLLENDIIGIVRGTSVPWNLVGNYDLFVYRLRKYTSENLLTIEIDDDEAFEISDDDDDPNADSGIICLDLVDPKVEHDLCVQFSRDYFNAEIKQELLDLDEFEDFRIEVKKEPSNFFEIETLDGDGNETTNISTFDPHLAANDESNIEDHQSESNDSTDTIMFSPKGQQQEDDQNLQNEPASDSDDVNKPIDDGCQEIVSIDANRDSYRIFVEDKLKIIFDKSKRRKGPELIKAKPLKRKCVNAENKKRNGIEPKSTAVNKKLRTETKCETKVKTQTTAKVKYTKDNRGSFLTDATQIPGLPPVSLALRERRKSVLITPVPCTKKQEVIDKEVDKEVDEILSKLEFSDVTPDKPVIDDPNYSYFKAKKLSFNDLRKADNNENNGPKSPTQNGNGSLDHPNDDYISDEPSITARCVHQSYTANDNHNVQNEQTAQSEAKRQAVVKESVFQINPCHELISTLTSYEADKFKTVDAFCRSIDPNVNSFGDSFKDYSDYRK